MHRQETTAGRIRGRMGRRLGAAAWAAALVLAGLVPSAGADPSPTGRTPRLLWSPGRQAIWNRLRAENHPWWLALKSSADKSATSQARYADEGQWATVAYQVTGDRTYAEKAWKEASPKLKGTSVPDSNRNFTREHFAEYVWMYDWLYPALTPEQRAQFLLSLNYWADLCLSRVPGVSWGTRLGDSDETTGHYFGLVFLALATAEENPSAAELLTLSSIGGLVSTGVNRRTMRNAIADYVARAEGGVWVESSEYNLGTLQLLLMGAEGVRTATGTEVFPEVTRLTPQVALAQMHELSPNLRQAYQWGDVEGPRSLQLERRLPLLTILCGLLQQDPSTGPMVQGFHASLAGSPGTQYQTTRSFVFYNPYAARDGDWSAKLARTHFAPGGGLLFMHDGWEGSRTLFGAHMPQRLGVDHEVRSLGHFQLYRQGEWVLTYPIGYDANEGEHHNAMLIAGLSSMGEARGVVAEEAAADGSYAYLAGATGGNPYGNGYYDPPPSYLHEWTRSLFYLPSRDGRSDILVVFDRTHAEDPETLPKLERHRSGELNRIVGAAALKQWILHTPVPPTLEPGVIRWTTLGGQVVRVDTLLPADQTRRVLDENLIGLKGYYHGSEKKHQVRISPAVEQPWDTFLNVIRVSSADGGFRNTLVRSALGEAEGVLVQRDGHPDVAVLFNAAPSPKLPPVKKSNGYLVTDPALLETLKQTRLRRSGYLVTWASGGSTDAYVMDLDPTKQWLITVDSREEALLPVSQSGIAHVNVSGAGSHTVQLRASGDAPTPDAPPPVPPAPFAISSVQVSGLAVDSARVSWATNEPASAQMDYGPTPAYGFQIPEDTTLRTAHSVPLTGLAPTTTYYYRVTSRSASGASATWPGTFATLSAPANQAPVLAPIGNRDTAEGQLLTITLQGTDPDGDPLTYSASGLPDGATLNSPTFTWTPKAGQAGTYSVTFSVSDGQLTDLEIVTITVTPPAGGLITNIRASSVKPYAKGAVQVGAAYYIDRTYILKSAPAKYLGQEYIRTANNDKYLKTTNHLSFTLTAPAMVSVAFDSRATSLPGWLGDGSWAATGETLGTTDVPLRLYQKAFPAGPVTLGGNAASPMAGAQSHYLVLAIPGTAPTATSLITSVQVGNGKVYRSGTLQVGAAYYIDRTYILKSAPAKYLGQEYIRTANNDKYLKTTNHLSFTLTAPAMVSVAFDSRATSLPGWLGDGSWAATGETLGTTDVPLRLYQKAFPAGPVTLGGNAASPMAGAQSHYLVIVSQ